MTNKTPRHPLIFLGLITLLLSSCIGDDFVFDFRDPELRIVSSLDTLEVNTTFQMEYMYLNTVGESEEVDAIWSSADDNIATVTEDGLLTGVSIGDVMIRIQFNGESGLLTDEISVSIGNATVSSETVFTGVIQTTSTYKLEGSFTLSDNLDGSLNLKFNDDYCASTALPGLYVYLSNNRNTVTTAYEIGRVTDFSGSHSYTIQDVGIMDYAYLVYFCKPFNVKVGDGEIQ